MGDGSHSSGLPRLSGLMTTLVIDITDPQSDSTAVPASMPTITATTIGQLEQNIADLVDANQALEERLDKQGNMIHQLETQDLSRMIREIEQIQFQACNESPFRARFKDKLPSLNEKSDSASTHVGGEIMTTRTRGSQMLLKALQKSIIRDESEQLMPTGSPPPPPSGASGASGPTGTSDSAQDPPPPPPSSTTNRGDQSHSSAAPGSSKTAASTAYTAWTTTTSRLEDAAAHLSLATEDVYYHEESDLKIRDMGSDEEIVTVGIFPNCYLTENSLLSQTGDIGRVVYDWFCKKQGITELTPEHLEGQIYLGLTSPFGLEHRSRAFIGNLLHSYMSSVTPPKIGRQRNSNIGVLLQGTKHKSRKTTSKETF
ncbi:hypothetical protein Tco_0904736 [Tanacetum coccineum]